jgi:hypothetical protein
LAGCTSSAEDADAGSLPAFDARGRDAAAPLGPDATSPGRIDASSSIDAGSVDAHVRRDAHIEDPGPDVCPTHPLAAYEGPFCSDAARSCIEACEPGCDVASVAMTCLTREPYADVCYYCMFWNSVLCAAEHGCQRAWDLYNCCGERECATAPDGEACIAERCGLELEAFTTCTSTRVADGTCALSATPCFPM